MHLASFALSQREERASRATVIGNSVNVASRVESLCSKLGVSILATDDFVQRLSSGKRDWAFKGEYLLKGVTDPVGVHELQLRPEESS